jgi:hypothetical protein
LKSVKDLTVAQRLKVKKTIDNMPDSKHELVYAIIKMYQLNDRSIEDPYVYQVIPYNGVVDGYDVNFNFNSFPNKLKQILLKFSDIHEKSDC